MKTSISKTKVSIHLITPNLPNSSSIKRNMPYVSVYTQYVSTPIDPPSVVSFLVDRGRHKHTYSICEERYQEANTIRIQSLETPFSSVLSNLSL